MKPVTSLNEVENSFISITVSGVAFLSISLSGDLRKEVRRFLALMIRNTLGSCLFAVGFLLPVHFFLPSRISIVFFGLRMALASLSRVKVGFTKLASAHNLRKSSAVNSGVSISGSA